MLQRANGCEHSMSSTASLDGRNTRPPATDATVPPPVAAAACGTHVPDVP